MEKLEVSDFNGDVQMLLDVTLSLEFYIIYKEISKYSSFTSFCRGMISGLRLKKESAFAYLFKSMKEFNKVSGFNQDFSMEYIINFLMEERYIKYCEISQLKYDILRRKK